MLASEAHEEPWFAKWTLRHALFSLGFATLILVMQFMNIFDMQRQHLALVVVLVSVLGVPHGAMDHLVVEKRMRTHSPRYWLLLFVAVYVAISIFVVIFWVSLPQISLILFLSMSIFHFGVGDFYTAPGGSEAFSSWAAYQVAPGLAKCLCGAEILARGGAVIVTSCYVHTAEVTSIFGHIMFGSEAAAYQNETAGLVRLLLWYVLIHWACALIMVVWRSYMLLNPQHPASPAQLYHLLAIMELLVLHSLSAIGNPLVAFAIYFCLFHSARHVLLVAYVARKEDCGCSNSAIACRVDLFNAVKHAVPFSVVSLVTAAYVWSSMVNTLSSTDFLHQVEGSTGSTLRVMFVGLSAVTLPHMAAIEYYRLRDRLASSLQRDRAGHW